MQGDQLMAELKAAQESADEINREERNFGWGASKFGHIGGMIAKLEPYNTLWTTAFEFFDKSNKWMNQPFKDVVAEEVEEVVGEMYRKVYKLTKAFPSGGSAAAEAPLKVAAEVRSALCSAQHRRAHAPVPVVDETTSCA